MKFRIYRYDSFWNESFPVEVKEFKDAFEAHDYCTSLHKSGGYIYHHVPLEEDNKQKLAKESSLRAQLEEIELIKKGQQ